MTINLTPLLLIAGIHILGTVLQKFLTKGGNETGAYIVGLAEYLFGILIVLKMIKPVIDEVFSIFFMF